MASTTHDVIATFFSFATDGSDEDRTAMRRAVERNASERQSVDPGENTARPTDPLTASLAAGDHAAFARAFDLYYPALVKFAHRYVPSQAAAEDIAQDAFVRLWERRVSLDVARSVRAYLYAIARNRALNLVAHDAIVREYAEAQAMWVYEGGARSNAPNASASVTTDTPTAPAADAVVLTEELIRAAEAAINALSPRLREVYRLSRDHGLSPADIASVLGTSRNTVYAQLAKIAQQLHEALAPWVEE